MTVKVTDIPRSDMGDLNTMHDATMITTLLSVLATLCVTGPKEEGVEGFRKSKEEKKIGKRIRIKIM